VTTANEQYPTFPKHHGAHGHPGVVRIVIVRFGYVPCQNPGIPIFAME
jgi:hypothetical protein